MVNVTNRADVYVRFITFKLFLSHDGLLDVLAGYPNRV
jgi:hypothetical protein